jgi:hypothetical protein
LTKRLVRAGLLPEDEETTTRILAEGERKDAPGF